MAYGWAGVPSGAADAGGLDVVGGDGDGDGDGLGWDDAGDGDGLGVDGVGEGLVRRSVGDGLGVRVGWSVEVGLVAGEADPVAVVGGRTQK